MAKIRVTKEFRFEAAHALEGYDGACRHIHGHSYILYVTVIGTPLSDSTSPKEGMVVDFSLLKGIVKRHVVDIYDHAFIVDERTGSMPIPIEGNNIIKVSYRPTCENMVADFAELISSELPEGIELHHIKLHETATSYAEWYREDNI